MFRSASFAASMAALCGALCFATSAQAQNASGKFTCDGETYNIESAVAAWVPETKVFTVWAFASKFSDDELKAYAFISSRLAGTPKAYSDKALEKAGWDMRTKTRDVKRVMLQGYLKEPAQKVEWTNLRSGALMYVNCLKNANLNFNMHPGDKKPMYDIAKAFKSFDFPLKDGAKVKYQTVAFKHDANPKGIDTKTTWDYKVDAKVYTVE